MITPNANKTPKTSDTITAARIINIWQKLPMLNYQTQADRVLERKQRLQISGKQ